MRESRSLTRAFRRGRRGALQALAALAGSALGGCGHVPAPVDERHVPRFDPSTIPPAPRVALVLSSGGPRGFAHLGVLKVLQREGIVPDLLVGSSSGALVSVLFAADPTAAGLQALEERALALSALEVLDYDLFRRRVNGYALQSWVNAAVGGRLLEGLARPVAVVATRTDDDAPVAFTRGNAGVAIRASSAVPGTFAPVDVAGVTYIDGDVGAPLPVALARAFGARNVIAVDVAQDVRRAPAPAGAPGSWTEEALARRRKIEREAPGADVIVAPPLPYLTGFSVEYRRMAIATGERAASAALPALMAAVSD